MTLYHSRGNLVLDEIAEPQVGENLEEKNLEEKHLLVVTLKCMETHDAPEAQSFLQMVFQFDVYEPQPDPDNYQEMDSLNLQEYMYS